MASVFEGHLQFWISSVCVPVLLRYLIPWRYFKGISEVRFSSALNGTEAIVYTLQITVLISRYLGETSRNPQEIDCHQKLYI